MWHTYESLGSRSQNGYVDLSLIELADRFSKCTIYNVDRMRLESDTLSAVSVFADHTIGQVVVMSCKSNGYSTGSTTALPAKAAFRAEIDGVYFDREIVELGAIIGLNKNQRFSSPGDSGGLIRDQVEPIALGMLVGGIQEPEDFRPLDISAFRGVPSVKKQQWARRMS